MKHEPTPRTRPEDGPPPVVIHREADDTILARWLLRAMEKGLSFWLMVGGAAVVVLGVGYLIGGLSAGQSGSAKAWSEEILATTPEELRKVAADHEGSTAAGWALLRAAAKDYQEGVTRLPADREAAAPLLSQALEGFKTAAEKAGGDSILKRMAALGVARTYEARDELSEAIAQYEKVAKDWPETDDAKTASARVTLLRDPETVAFYRKFASFTPPKTPSLGPRGSNPLGGFPANHPSMDGPIVPAPPLSGVPAGSVPRGASATPAVGGGEFPKNVFQKSTPPSPSPDPKTPESTLPDVFPKSSP